MLKNIWILSSGSDENIEHNLIRQMQYATTRECRRYRMIHAKELLSHKLDARSEAEYHTIRDKLKISDEERFADAWLDMSDRDRRIICMRFGVEDGKRQNFGGGCFRFPYFQGTRQPDRKEIHSPAERRMCFFKENAGGYGVVIANPPALVLIAQLAFLG